MLSYCLKCERNTESKNKKVARAKNGRIMLLSKSKFIKQQKPRLLRKKSRLLRSLGLKTGDSQYIYQNIYQDKACFQHDMTYGDFKDLTRKTVSDKISRKKAFNMAKNPEYDGYKRGLASMFIHFLVKNPLLLQINLKNENISNKKLHKPIIKKFKKRKVQPPFIDNI